jgi:two-component system, OmpR family, sensor histidine kinase QseC
VLLLTWSGLGGIAYTTGLDEAREITDGQLVSAAELLLRVKAQGLSGQASSHARPIPSEAIADRYTAEMHVVAWEDGRLTWDTHGMADQLPPSLVDGHHTLVLATDSHLRTWRLYVATAAHDAGPARRVAVMTDTARHAELALDMAEHIIRPAIFLFPLAALLLIWAIRRGLRPLRQLAADMAALDVRAGQRLEGKQAFVELESTVQAIHHLVDQLQQQWARERQFNADVAHELRTPLTSAVLQAGLAQEADTPEQRERALKQVAAESLRAASILTQLLDLARAQRAEQPRGQTVDLRQLAREACVNHLGLAHEWGQSLSLRAPDEPAPVEASPELLGLALRNLVDNALRHNPHGTHVEVSVSRRPSEQRLELAVSDDGELQQQTSSRSGMGVGLTLVRRIADAQGAVFRQEPGEAPYTRRFVLAWPARV